MRYTLIALALFDPLAAAEYTIPTARRPVSWEAGVVTGVVGGIPTRSGGNVISVTTYGWSSGASAATNSAAFNSAVAASASGDIISIPAGTFATNGLGISYARFNASYNNRTVRGAGMNATILRHEGSSDGFKIGEDTDTGNANPETTVTTMTRGSAVITVADGAAVWSSGRQIARINLPNESSTPIASVSNYSAVRNPTVCIIGRTGNDLTLSQPLPSGFAAAAAAGTVMIKWVHSADNRKTIGVGLEDLTIDGVNASGASATTRMGFAEGCWFKNIKIVNPANYAIFQFDTTNCEIRHCYIDSVSGGTNHAGLLITNSSYALIEDNIFTNGGPEIEANFSVTNSVFAYNYGQNGFNGNHGPHNSYNLWEGNTFGYYQADGYFGGVSEETFFRNWNRSGALGSLKRFTRNFNFIGNIVGIVGTTYTTDYVGDWGNPNIGNESSSGTASLIGTSGAAAWADWDSGTGRPLALSGVLTTRTSDSAGVITLSSGGGAKLAASNAANGDVIRAGAGHGQKSITNISGDVVTFARGSHTTVSEGSAVTVLPGAPGFQQRDLDVAATTIRKGNWYVLTGNIPAGESLGGDTLPASYFRATKPSWFGDRPWPPYNSASPGTPAIANIPAGYRYVYGVDPNSGPKSPPQNVRIRLQP